MAENGNLIPSEVLTQLDELEKNLKNSLKSSGEFLKMATDINKQLGENMSGWKNLNKILGEYARMENSVIAIQKEHYAVLERKNKLIDKVIRSNSRQVKEAKNLSRATREQKAAQREAIEEAEKYVEPNEEGCKSLIELKQCLRKLKKELNYKELLNDVEKGILDVSEAMKRLNEQTVEVIRLQYSYSLSLMGGAIKAIRYEIAISKIGIINKKVQRTFESLIKSNKEVENSVESLTNKALKQLKEYLEQVINVLIEKQNEVRKVQENIKELNEEYVAGSLTLEQYLEKQNKLISVEEQQLLVIERLIVQRKLLNQIVGTQIGSYSSLAAQYALLKLQLDTLRGAEGNSSEQLRKLAEQIEKLKKSIDALSESLGEEKSAIKDTLDTLGMLSDAFELITTYGGKIMDLLKKMGPKGAAIAVILVAVIGGITYAYKKHTEAERELLELDKKAAKSAGDELARLKLLYKAATDENETRKERLRCVEKLQTEYPDFFANVEKEEILNGKLEKSYDKLYEQIFKTAKAKELFEQLPAKVAQAAVMEREVNRLAEKHTKVMEKTGSGSSAQQHAYSEWTAKQEKLNELKSEINALIAKINVADFNFDPTSETRAAEKEGAAALALAQLRINVDAEASREIIANMANEYGTRLDALDNFNNLQIRAIYLNMDKQLENQMLLETEKILIREQAEADVTRIEKEGEKERRALLQEQRNAIYQLAAFKLSTEIELEGEILRDTKKKYADRFAAFENFYEQQEKAIKLAMNNQLSQEGLSAEARALIVAKANAELAKLKREQIKKEEELEEFRIKEEIDCLKRGLEDKTNLIIKMEDEKLRDLSARYKKGEIDQLEYENSKKKLTQESVQERYEAEIEMLEELMKISGLSDEQIAAAKKQIDDATYNYHKSINELIAEEKMNEINQAEMEQLVALSEAYKNGEIDKETYERGKTETTRRAAKERYETEIEMLEQMLDIENLTADQIRDIDQQIADAKVKYNQKANEQMISDNEDFVAKQLAMEEKMAEAREQLAKELANFANQMVSNVFANKIKKIEQELSTLNEYYEEKNKLIEEQEAAGLITAEYAAAQKSYLAEQQREEEEALQEKKKEIQLRQAKYEKAQSLVSAAINTAIAITAAWKTPFAAPALVPLIAATGAIQIATIMAQPLPEYKHGTSDHPGGPAIVGDGGRPEMVVYPDGSLFKTPGVSTLVNLPEHAQVLPDYTKALNNLAFSSTSGGEAKQTIIISENKEQVFLLRESNRLSRELILSHTKQRNNSLYSNLITHSKYKTSYKK